MYSSVEFLVTFRHIRACFRQLQNKYWIYQQSSFLCVIYYAWFYSFYQIVVLYNTTQTRSWIIHHHSIVVIHYCVDKFNIFLWLYKASLDISKRDQEFNTGIQCLIHYFVTVVYYPTSRYYNFHHNSVLRILLHQLSVQHSKYWFTQRKLRRRICHWNSIIV